MSDASGDVEDKKQHAARWWVAFRLEDGEEAAELRVEAADAERLRSALGEALEARNTEEIRTPDGELAYDTIQMVRHVLLSSEGVRLGRTSG